MRIFVIIQILLLILCASVDKTLQKNPDTKIDNQDNLTGYKAIAEGQWVAVEGDTGQYTGPFILISRGYTFDVAPESDIVKVTWWKCTWKHTVIIDSSIMVDVPAYNTQAIFTFFSDTTARFEIILDKVYTKKLEKRSNDPALECL